MIWGAVALGVLSAIGLALGTHLQASAVVHHAGQRLRLHHVPHLLRSPRWVAGLACIGLGTACNVIALSLAPVTVIQPIGVLALILTTVLHARHTGTPITAAMRAAIGLCAAGAVLFVLLAVRVTDAALEVTARAAGTVTVLQGAVVVLVLLGCAAIRRRRDIVLLASAGVLYGFVAVQMKVLTAQVRALGEQWWSGIQPLTVLGLVAAAALGAWLVQSAYAAGPPDLVMAGLTVVDPMVGVLLGLSVLGEAGRDFGPLAAAGLVACGAVSMAGVRTMARHHPEVLERHGSPASADGGR